MLSPTRRSARNAERKSARTVQKPKVYVARIDSRRSYSFSEESSTERRGAKRSTRLPAAQAPATRSSPRKRKFLEPENGINTTSLATTTESQQGTIAQQQQHNRFDFQFQPPTTGAGPISPKTLAEMKKKARSQFETKLKQAKVGMEMDEAEILAQVPETLKELFGQVGFAKWTRMQLPALVLSPFKVPQGPVRKSWLDHFHMVRALAAGAVCFVPPVVEWCGAVILDFARDSFVL